MYVYLNIKSLYPPLKVNWNALLCRICIARRLVVDIFPWCNANFVPFPSGTLVARRMRNGSIVTPCKCSFKEIVPKLSVNFGNRVSQDSHKNQYPGPDCNFGFTVPQYSDKCWSNLPLKCHIFLIGNAHRSYCITYAIIRCMLWLVGTSYHVLFRKHNKMTSSLLQYQCIPGKIRKFLILVPFITHGILTKRN